MQISYYVTIDNDPSHLYAITLAEESVSDRPLLIIEDDDQLVEIVTKLLTKRGFQVEAGLNGQEGLAALEKYHPLLVILDLRLPDMAGIEVLQQIRAKTNIPVLILSSTTEDSKKVEAFEEGADDYVTKPFDPAELTARINALLRRLTWIPQTAHCLRVGNVELDLARHQARRDGEPLLLTPIEFMLLTLLMEQAGGVVSHEALLTSVWGPGYKGDLTVLRVNISRLRNKLKGGTTSPDFIETIPHAGYRIPAPRQD